MHSYVVNSGNEVIEITAINEAHIDSWKTGSASALSDLHCLICWLSLCCSLFG